MSNIDEKLDAILKRVQKYAIDCTLANIGAAKTTGQWVIHDPNRSAALAEIKAVFQEEGWLSPETVSEIGKRKLDFGHRWGMLTGQEWYGKFRALAPEKLTEADELDFNLHDDDPEGNCYFAYNCAIDEMAKAAKRAAGIAE